MDAQHRQERPHLVGQHRSGRGGEVAGQSGRYHQRRVAQERLATGGGLGMDLDRVELHQDRARIELTRWIASDLRGSNRAARESDVVVGRPVCDRLGGVARPGRLLRIAGPGPAGSPGPVNSTGSLGPADC
jgi:hypothetical protein